MYILEFEDAYSGLATYIRGIFATRKLADVAYHESGGAKYGYTVKEYNVIEN